VIGAAPVFESFSLTLRSSSCLGPATRPLGHFAISCSRPLAQIWQMSGRSCLRSRCERPIACTIASRRSRVISESPRSLGFVGYHYEQITGDSGAGATLGDFKGRVTAVGANIQKYLRVRQSPAHSPPQVFPRIRSRKPRRRRRGHGDPHGARLGARAIGGRSFYVRCQRICGLFCQSVIA
jgi:hypothetical protein